MTNKARPYGKQGVPCFETKRTALNRIRCAETVLPFGQGSATRFHLAALPQCATPHLESGIIVFVLYRLPYHHFLTRFNTYGADGLSYIAFGVDFGTLMV